MPRYYFHMDTGSRTTDRDGIELEGPVEARRQAIVTCGEMMKDAPEGFWGSRPWSVTVTDATGLILWTIEVDGVASAATLKPQATL